MNWRRWLVALFVMMALAACAQGGQVPYAPYSQETMHDRGVTVTEEVEAGACSAQWQSYLAQPLRRSRG
jgi:hypothetical protein